jgi:acyl-CoA reductase-like NAD-dependent aldehyde dehydrogenase
MREVSNYIGGRWEERNGQSTESVHDPATGAVIADTPSLLSHARFLANTIR